MNVTITITQKEWEAIAAAWALMHAEMEGDPEWEKIHAKDNAALQRIKRKVYAALDEQKVQA